MKVVQRSKDYSNTLTNMIHGQVFRIKKWQTPIWEDHYEEFEDTKWAIRNRISNKNRQHNGKKKNDN